MTFYQELQLSSAGSKQLIKNTQDSKEKRRHILIYNFKVYLVMIFCVAVVTVFSKLLGNNNKIHLKIIYKNMSSFLFRIMCVLDKLF